MDDALVAPNRYCGAASARAQPSAGHAEVLLPPLDHRRSVGLIEAAELIGVYHGRCGGMRLRVLCPARSVCGLGVIGASAAGNWGLGGLSCKSQPLVIGTFVVGKEVGNEGS